VPASLIEFSGTYGVTVNNPGACGGISDPNYIFITQTGAVVTDWESDTNDDPGGSAQATSGGSGPSTPGSLTANGYGTGTVIVAHYGNNPGGTPTFSTTGRFMDVNISQDHAFSSMWIEYCNLGGGTEVFWWDGEAWVEASNQVYDPTTQCVTASIDETTSPSLSDLTGTPFGASGVSAYLPIVVK
jgi:hypothetical protein